MDLFSARLSKSGLQHPPTRAVDLDTLSTELLAVVDQTVQPTRVVAAARPDGYTRELRQFADTRPEVRFILLATQPGQVLGPLRGDQRPANLAILSEPLGDQALTDALACLFADRYAVGT